MPKPDKPPCLCSHTAKEHDHTKRSPGCTVRGCSCLAYHLTPFVGWLTGEALARELEHWAYHTGRPVDSKQMTVAECHKAHAREQFKQRRTILVRKIEETARRVIQARASWEYEAREHKRKMRASAQELAGMYAKLAALPEVVYERRKQKGRAA